MYCADCGKKISTDTKFCPKCGGKISAKETFASNSNGDKPSGHRTLKVMVIFLAALAILIIVPAIGYIFTAYGPATYKHPSAGFTFTYYKSLKVETPALPADAKCKAAAPCLVVLKNPTYNDYIINWFLVISAADAGVDKETLVGGATKGFQSDINAGIATTTMIGNTKVYKYESNSEKSTNTIAVFAQMMDFDPALQKTMYAFATGDSIVAIFFTKPPPGSPGIYTNYLDISSLTTTQ